MSTRKFITDPSIPDEAIIDRTGPRNKPVQRKGQKDPLKPGSKARGTISDDTVLDAFLLAQTGPVTKGQVGAMAKLLGRTPENIKKAMIRARHRFVSKAERYVELHGEATEEAMLRGDHEIVIKASQWAMTNLAAEGVRIIDKPEAGADHGTKVLIGVQIGGVDQPKVLIGQIAPSTPVETEPIVDTIDD